MITELKLYEAPGFRGGFAQPLSRLSSAAGGARRSEAQAWLLERFQRRLHVQTLPRTLLIEIRFRSRDAALSAAVVNALIRAYGQQDSESQMEATAQASDWLRRQLKDLKARVDQDEQRLSALPERARHSERAGDAGQRAAGRDASITPRCWRLTSWAGNWWPPPRIAFCARPSTGPPRRAIRSW